MKLKNLLGLTAACLVVFAAAGLSRAHAVRKPPSNRYTVTIAYCTATPKPLRPGQVRGKNTNILPDDGIASTLDISTPVRFRKMMEGVSRDYDYSLDLSTTVTCDNGTDAQTQLKILPDPKDPNRLQMTGLVWVSRTMPTMVKLMLTSIGAFMQRSGDKGPVQVFSLTATKNVSLGRTYVAGASPASKTKDPPINLLIVSVVAGG